MEERFNEIDDRDRELLNRDANTRNNRRSNLYNNWSLSTILRRGGTLLTLGAAGYFALSHLQPEMGNIGAIVTSGSVRNLFRNRVSWEDVRASFWEYWILLARYYRGS